VITIDFATSINFTMLFRLLILLLVTTISIIQALTIPDHKAEELSLITWANSTLNVNSTSEGVAWDEMYCGCGFNMNIGNTNEAVLRLKMELQLWWDADVYIPAHNRIFSIVKDVVAFYCNGDKDVRVHPDELHLATQKITEACGSYIAGTQRSVFFTVFPWPRKDHWDLGYMRYRPGLDFCHDAVTSPVNHC
jgi:hypothetical protein